MGDHDQNEGGDIEQQQQTTAKEPPYTAAAVTGDPLPAPKPKPWLTCIHWMAAHTFFVILLPLLTLYVLVSLCLTGSADGIHECRRRILGEQSHSPSSSTVFFKSTKVGLIFQRTLQVWVTRLGMTSLICMTVNICVPRFRRVNLIEGWLLWKLFLLVVTVTLGYPIACLISAAFINIVTFGGLLIRKTPMEYYIIRLGDNIATVFYFGFILVIWLLYFRTSHGLDRSQYSNMINDLGTWSLASLLVGSILWVAKNAMLLKWRANVVYMRFKPRILRAGLQLYILYQIVSGLKLQFLIPWRDHVIMAAKDAIDEDQQGADEEGLFTKDLNGVEDRRDSSNQVYMMAMPVSMFEMYSVSDSLMCLAHVALRENDGNPEIVRKYQEKIPTSDVSRNVVVTKENLEENFNLAEEDAELLLQELGGDLSSEEITYEAFLKWMVNAHTSCLLLGYTLIDAMDVIQGLNKVVTPFIVAAVIVLWLIVTGVANLKVFVLITSPILAFTFVFGDTCKAFFQGVMFSFVTHPFDIGDRCIIDENELEVKRISIMTTTFLKIGTKEKVVYPNADLANKPITNHEAEPNPNDVIELILDTSTTKPQLLALQDKLKGFLENEKGVYQKNYKMMVSEMGNTIKVCIHFTHVLSIEDISHSQCYQKKNEQRSAFFIEIKQFLDDLKIKSPTSVY